MRVYNTFYKGSKEFEKFLSSIDTSNSSSILAQIFSGIQDETLLKEIIYKINDKFKDITIIGASTAGEIFEGETLEESIVISISVFENTSILSFCDKDKDSFLIGQNIAKNIVRDDTKAVILFADGLLRNGESILKGIKSAASKKITVSGGMAGDYNKFIKTFVIHGDSIFENGAVAVSLNSPNLIVHNSYSLSWKPIGIPMTVTKAKENIVYEIDDKPIIDIYREYLGEEIVKRLPASAIEFPLIFEKDGMLVARSIINVDNGSISFAGEIPEGTKVRFGAANTKIFAQEGSELFERNSKYPIESIFVYSCIARKMFLGKNISAEMKPLSKLAHMCGFFTFGEFYSGENSLEMLNITTTILALSERDKIDKKIEYKPNLEENLSLSTTALIHLVEKSIDLMQKESKKKEDLIAELNQYQKAIDKTFLVSKTDTKGVITYVNDLFCKISGYSKEELIGSPHSIVRHPDMPKEVFKDLWQTIKSKKIWHGIVKNRRKDGKSYYVDATIFPILNKDGDVKEYVAIRKDVTDIKVAQQRTEEILNAEDSIVLLASAENSKAKTKHLNKKFFELFDYKDTKDFLKKHECICELFINKEGYLSKVMNGKPWIDYLLEHQNSVNLAVMMDKFNNERIFNVKAKLIHLDTEDFIITTFSDVTELEKARVEALSAERAKTAFLATMSHELRTPLNAIIGFSQILMHKKDLNPDMLKTYLEKIYISGNHLLSLINDVLDFSKLEADKMDVHIEKVDLTKLFDEVIMMLEVNAAKKGIKIIKKYPQDIYIYADKKLLKQVLINILGNAIKFTPNEKKITVKYDCDSKSHFLEICDEGIGLTKEQISKIFNPFSQVREHQKSSIKGTGLGLAISKKIIELHKGKIEVQSELNKGSCFKIILPKEMK